MRARAIRAIRAPDDGHCPAEVSQRIVVERKGGRLVLHSHSIDTRVPERVSAQVVAARSDSDAVAIDGVTLPIFLRDVSVEDLTRLGTREQAGKTPEERGKTRHPCRWSRAAGPTTKQIFSSCEQHLGVLKKRPEPRDSGSAHYAAFTPQQAKHINQRTTLTRTVGDLV